MTSQLLNYAGVGLGVLGIVLSILLAVRYSERKVPSAYVTNDIKIATFFAPPTLELRYKGRVIPTLTSTYVWFWNAGRRPIKREDIASKQPIRIAIGTEGETGAEIVDNPIIRRVSRESIGFAASLAGPTTVELVFDFLDYKDGALIEIQHTGPVWGEASLSGVILGAPSGIKTWRRQEGIGRFIPFILGGGSPRWPQLKRDRMLRRGLVLLVLAFFWGFAIVALKTANVISATPHSIADALKGIASAPQIALVTSKLQEADNFTRANRVLPYVVGALALLVTLITTWALIRPNLALPESLVVNPWDEPAPHKTSIAASANE